MVVLVLVLHGQNCIVNEICPVRQVYKYLHVFYSLIQIEIFEGIENIVTLNQSHSKIFHCTYLLHYFPFDTQVKEALRKN